MIALRLIAIVVTLILVFYAFLVMGISIVSNSGWTATEAVAMCRNGYLTVIKTGNKLVDFSIETFIDILNYIRRKRLGKCDNSNIGRESI